MRRVDLQYFTIKPTDISFKLGLYVNVVFCWMTKVKTAKRGVPSRTHRSTRQILSEPALSVIGHHTTPDLGNPNQCSAVICHYVISQKFLKMHIPRHSKSCQILSQQCPRRQQTRPHPPSFLHMHSGSCCWSARKQGILYPTPDNTLCSGTVSSHLVTLLQL